MQLFFVHRPHLVHHLLRVGVMMVVFARGCTMSVALNWLSQKLAYGRLCRLLLGEGLRSSSPPATTSFWVDLLPWIFVLLCSAQPCKRASVSRLFMSRCALDVWARPKATGTTSSSCDLSSSRPDFCFLPTSHLQLIYRQVDHTHAPYGTYARASRMAQALPPRVLEPHVVAFDHFLKYITHLLYMRQTLMR